MHTHQHFTLADIRWHAERPAHTPYFLSNPHMYMVASLGGQCVAYGDEHTVGKMGGLWAHPIRVADGWYILVDGTALPTATSCTTTPSTVSHVYHTDTVHVTVAHTFVVDQSAVVGRIHIHNPHAQGWEGNISLGIDMDIHGCWFGGMPVGAEAISTPHHVEFRYQTPVRTHTVVVQSTLSMPWQIVGNRLLAGAQFHLAPGATTSFEFVIASSLIFFSNADIFSRNFLVAGVSKPSFGNWSARS